MKSWLNNTITYVYIDKHKPTEYKRMLMSSTNMYRVQFTEKGFIGLILFIAPRVGSVLA